MNRFLTLILTMLLFAQPSVAQQNIDTTGAAADSIAGSANNTPAFVIDSFSKRPQSANSWKSEPGIVIGSAVFINDVLKRHPYFGFGAKRLQAPPSLIRESRGKDLLFYVLLFLFIVFALLKRAFPKYFSDMFRLVFRTTLKQRQVREQLMQTPLPALMLNIFFCIIAGFYIGFLLDHYNANPLNNFWLLVLYSALGITAIYFIKLVGLKFSGWLFNMEQAAGSYIFIIFIINKMIGIILLPFIVLLAFTSGGIYTTGLTLSWLVIAGLLIYRFILTYAAVRNDVKVNPFHFFLYLLAFEVAPLLLVYKGLLLFFRINS